MNLNIRVAQLTDIADIVEILSSSFYSQTGLIGWLTPILRLGISEDLRQRLQNASASDRLVVVAVLPPNCHSSSYVVGSAEITYRSLGPFSIGRGYYPYLSNLAVRSEYRRQGVAQQLLRACEVMAQAQSFASLYLHVLDDNDPAKQLYFNAGYQVQSARSDCQFWLFPRPKKLLLSKTLSNRSTTG